MAKKVKKLYRVGVSRTGYGYNTLDIEATSQKEAQEKALECAGEFSFSEHDADYAVEGITLIRKIEE